MAFLIHKALFVFLPYFSFYEMKMALGKRIQSLQASKTNKGKLLITVAKSR